MRHMLTGILAASFAFGALAGVAQPALPAVRHLQIDHSPAPPVAVQINNASPTVTPIALPPAPEGGVCASCPPPNTGPCGACPAQPSTVKIGIVQVSL